MFGFIDNIKTDMKNNSTYGEPIGSSPSAREGTERWLFLDENVEMDDLLDEIFEMVLLTLSGT